MGEVDPGLGEEELLQLEAIEQAAESARIASAPGVLIADAAVSFPQLRALIRDELCAGSAGESDEPLPPHPAPGTAPVTPASCTAGLPLGSGLRAFLTEYARRHAIARAKWAAVESAVMARGPFEGHALFRPEEAAAVRWLIYIRCCGGLGDQLKGFSNALLASLVSPQLPTRALLLRWAGKIDMEAVWRPCPLQQGEATATHETFPGSSPALAGGIDWRPPSTLPVAGDEGVDQSRWGAMGLSVNGVAFQDNDVAANADISNSVSAGPSIILAWGNYVWPQHWWAAPVMRVGATATCPVTAAYWTAPDSVYRDGRRVAPGTPADASLGDLPVPLNDGARSVNAAVWCTLPIELRELLRVQGLCRAAVAHAGEPGFNFSDWRLAPDDKSLDILLRPPYERLREGADLSFAALHQQQHRAAGGNRRRLRAWAASLLSASKRIGNEGSGALGSPAPARNGGRKLQGGQCMAEGTFPSSREQVCNNPSSGSDSAWPLPGQRGAGGTNLALQLVDWLAWPTQRFLARLQPIMSAFRPGRQYVVGIHMRTGGANAGIAGDVIISQSGQLTGVATCCAAEAIKRLAALFGRREEVVLMAFSDNVAARVAVKRAFRGAVIGGMPVRVVDFASHTRVSHTDASVGRDSLAGEALTDSAVDAFVQHVLLSSSHVLVRSRSGFSESAQAWGRVPLAFQLRFSSQTCADVSDYEFRSMSAWERRRLEQG